MKSIIIPTMRPDEIDVCLDSIKKYTTDYEIILDTEKIGFVKSLNQAIKKAKGEYIILLHDDCEVTEGWADKLADVGAFCVGELNDSFDTWGGFYNPQGYCQDSTKNPDYAYFLCISKKAMEKIGDFDERFTKPWCQDVDMGFHIRSKGFKIECLPGKVIHHHSPSGRNPDEKIRGYIERKWGL